MSSPQNRSGRRVLIAGEWPDGDPVIAAISLRGLLSTSAPDRDTVMVTLLHHTSGALLLKLSQDQMADTTLLLRAVESDHHLAVVMVGDSIDANDVAHFVRQGAAACLESSQGATAIADAVAQALDRRESFLEIDRQTASLRAALQEVSRQLQKETGALRQRSVGSLESLVRAGEACHSHWAGHALRVADLAGAVAVAMGEDDSTVEKVRLAGRLHDLGMIGVPARILEKPGALTAAEFEIIKHHPVLASEILSGYPEFIEITRAIRGHHENWDGSGYPDRLAGLAIPPMARILAAVEVFDALISPRPYRPASEIGAALLQIKALAGTALDPSVCAALPLVLERRQMLSFVSEVVPPPYEIAAAGVLGPGHAD